MPPRGEEADSDEDTGRKEPVKRKAPSKDEDEDEKPKRKTSAKAADSDEEEEKPKRKTSKADSEEEKPKRKPVVEADSDEEVEKPKKPRSKKPAPKSDDEEEEKPKRASSKKEDSDEEEEKSSKKAKTEEVEEKKTAKKKKTPNMVPANMTAAEVKKELEKLGLVSSGSKKDVIARLSDALAAEGKLDPEHMNVAQLRAECTKLGLDSTGTKAVLMHNVTVERARLEGGDTEVFNPQLMTVAQLRKWLEGHGIDYDKSLSKTSLAALVAETVKQEESDKKENDVEMMKTEQLVQWLKDRGVKHKTGEEREYYAKLVESHMSKGGALLFPDDDILYQKKLFFGQRLIVVKGDITTCKAAAIVCPTNSALALDGGVGKALLKICGPKFLADIKKWTEDNPPLATTKACLTPGHELNANNVIHTNSPQYKPASSKASIEELTDSISSIFKVADENKLSNIALPSIGSGINGYPPDVAAKAILQAITAYFQNVEVSSSIREVYFVLFDDASVKVYTTTLTSL